MPTALGTFPDLDLQVLRREFENLLSSFLLPPSFMWGFVVPTLALPSQALPQTLNTFYPRYMINGQGQASFFAIDWVEGGNFPQFVISLSFFLSRL